MHRAHSPFYPTSSLPINEHSLNTRMGCPLRYIVLLISMIIAAIGIMQTMENTEEEESQLASSKTAGKSKRNKHTLSSLQWMQSTIMSLFSGEFLVHSFSFGATRAAAKSISVQ